MPCFDHQKGQTIPVDGAELYFECCGDSKGSPLLLLHGGLGTIEDFESLAKQFGDFRIIATDARGHGRSSSGSASLTYQQLTNDALHVLDHLDCPRATVIGFSDGGIVGCRLAIQHAHRIEKLVTIGTSNRLTPATAPLLERVTAESWGAKFPDTKRQYEKHNPQPDFAALVQASKKMWLDISETGYPAGRITQITCPTLLIRGDNDHLVSLDEAVEQRLSIKNSSFLNVPNAGHVAYSGPARHLPAGDKEFL